MTKHVLQYILILIFISGSLFGLNGVFQMYYPLYDEFLKSTLYVKLNYVVIFLISAIMYSILYGFLVLLYIPIMILDLFL